ncbi:hypothetical protein Vretifemale_15218 [Volvox reticuliferus]|uniref:Thioredoxin domain-containing protein n=1 Tax=Volvox reticuliferus TaxID=1737510 RepID=A0A8J4CRC2_9CHLO|nr:hypothetical protein Vretifemale_15218 [Volvox reticuliferus]
MLQPWDECLVVFNAIHIRCLRKYYVLTADAVMTDAECLMIIQRVFDDLCRFDCMQNEDLCDRLGVDRTPTLKLFLNGTVVETYKADFYHVELMVPFLRKMLEKYKGVKQSKTQEDAAAATLESGSNASVTTSPEAASGPAGSAGTGPVYGEVKVQPDDVIQATPLETDVYYSPAGATSSEFGGDNDGEGGGAKVQSDNQLDMPTASGKWAKPDRAEDAILLEVAAAVAANVPDGSDGDPVGGCGGDRGGGEPVIRRGRRGGLAVETLQREREEL